MGSGWWQKWYKGKCKVTNGMKALGKCDEKKNSFLPPYKSCIQIFLRVLCMISLKKWFMYGDRVLIFLLSFGDDGEAEEDEESEYKLKFFLQIFLFFRCFWLLFSFVFPPLVLVGRWALFIVEAILFFCSNFQPSWWAAGPLSRPGLEILPPSILIGYLHFEVYSIWDQLMGASMLPNYPQDEPFGLSLFVIPI